MLSDLVKITINSKIKVTLDFQDRQKNFNARIYTH